MPDTPNEIAKASPDMRTQRIEQLRALLPDLFDGEGQLDEKALRALIGGEAGVAAERFSFDWAGKQKSKRLAYTPSGATLTYDAARSLNNDGTENKEGETPEQNTSENLIIEGDNLEVLKLLQATYFEQVKCIYIDPPYNTGKDFIYPDNFTEGKKAYWEKNGTIKEGVKLTALPESHGRRHSDWLNFMQSRLLLARQMLREDGVIFVSIDDNEVHNLRKLMDEIFGEDNFIGIFTVNSTPNARDYGHIGKMHEYVLFYSKKLGLTETNLIPEIDKKFTYSDEVGGFNIHPLYNSNVAFHSLNRPNLFYPFYVYPAKITKEGFFEIGLENQEGAIEVYPPLSKREQVQFVWRWGKKKSLININKEIIGYKTSSGEYRIIQKMRHSAKVIRSLLSDTIYSTRRGTFEVEEIFDRKIFSFPKPLELLKVLITSATSSNDITLDIFAGSGTSAHAVMQQNAEDGGNRKHIMVQIPEYTDEKSEAYKAGYKKISDITIERVKRAGAKIREENPDATIDTGFRVFKLTHSNFAENLFTPDDEKSEADNIKALEAHLAEAAQLRLFDTDAFNNLVTEISLKNGFGLFYQLETLTDFDRNKIYRLHGNGKSAILCLDDTLHDSSVEDLKSFYEEQLIVSKSALDTSKKFSLQTEFKDNLWVV